MAVWLARACNVLQLLPLPLLQELVQNFDAVVAQASFDEAGSGARAAEAVLDIEPLQILDLNRF